MVIDLIQIGMTSKCTKECVTPFKAFSRLILVKLDMSKTINSQFDQSFIFAFRHLIQVNSPPLHLFNYAKLYLSYADA